jgi:eukaryotic-like serine/threonine-protein kinase
VDVAAPDDAQSAKFRCLSVGATVLSMGGRYAEGAALLDVVDRAIADVGAPDLEAVAHLHQARSAHAICTGDLGAGATSLEAALLAFAQAGDHRNACSNRSSLGSVCTELGDFEKAQSMLRTAVEEADRMRLDELKFGAQANLAHALGYCGRLSEGRALAEAATVSSQGAGQVRTELFARCYLAKIALAMDDHKAAEREARAAIALFESAPTLGVQAFSLLARVLLALGRTDEAVRAATEASARLSEFGTVEEGESLVRLTYAEALAASGRRDEAEVAIRSAKAALLARAEKLSDPTWRERFLRDVPDNARTLELARDWLGG